MTHCVYPDLVSCTVPVEQILPSILTMSWSRGMGHLVRAQNIHTIGNLSALKEEQVFRGFDWEEYHPPPPPRVDGVLPTKTKTIGSNRKGYLFEASAVWKGRDFTSCKVWKGREICHFGLWNGPKGPTDTFYGFEKKTLKEKQCIYSGAVERDGKF